MDKEQPFLLQTADEPEPEQDRGDALEDLHPEASPEIFHTRCGHPRHRDD
ncbi:MAG: hypothetical protein AAB442_02995 [Patescibacteria group bacterium]